MKRLKFILKKEFRQIFRDKAMLPLIFAMPILQLLVLSFATTYDVKNINLEVVDRSQSSMSRALIHKFQASPYFNLTSFKMATEKESLAMEKGEAVATLEIPDDFESELVNGRPAAVALRVDAIDGMTGGVAASYIQSIIQEFRVEEAQNHPAIVLAGRKEHPLLIDVSVRNWFNPTLDYQYYMVPGLLVMLVTMIGMFLTSMNIVKEKEVGTIEQLNVTPITKGEFILGKLLPFWLIGLFVLSVGLILARLIFQVPMEGPMTLVMVFAMAYLPVVIGIGLFISNISDTQQQAMFVAWFIMIVFVLLSGLFTPIENMPEWAQYITYANPVRYFIEVNRGVLLKGASWADMKLNFIVVIAYAIVINFMAVKSYKKTV